MFSGFKKFSRTLIVPFPPPSYHTDEHEEEKSEHHADSEELEQETRVQLVEYLASDAIGTHRLHPMSSPPNGHSFTTDFIVTTKAASPLLLLEGVERGLALSPDFKLDGLYNALALEDIALKESFFPDVTKYLPNERAGVWEDVGLGFFLGREFLRRLTIKGKNRGCNALHQEGSCP